MAHARFVGNDQVSLSDVNEAMRLLDLYVFEKNTTKKNEPSLKHKIYMALCDAAIDNVIDLSQFYATTNFEREKVKEVIKSFSECSVWVETEDNELVIL